jgi:succinate dehydrogenase/fumarate reductase flavoprotein subunit
MRLQTDVLVIGAGGAGMYAAIEAARNGASVLLADRSLIGRGGATVMAQMTVAVALGEQCEDSVDLHLQDTLTAARGLAHVPLAELLCAEGPECIRELDAWGVGWAREDGHMKQAMAPGHSVPRCVYVDFLNTGPAVSRTLRTQVIRTPGIQRVGDLCIVDLVMEGGECVGATAIHLPDGQLVTIAAKATIVATGGLTRLYRRNSASVNMGGDGYALALRAGASLLDMEFVQFFPIGHLAPRMIGMDPIMWDPFRYKLGGKLLNRDMQEFAHRYSAEEGKKYVLTRDLATYAITKEVEAGRGSPHGGAWLSFQHCSDQQLRENFGSVIDRLAKNGIDLTKQPIEVAPIAHYHMGGVVVNTKLETGVPGLLAAGEAVGGANGANRLSGNAITEALVFGRAAGRTAAAYVKKQGASRPMDAAESRARDWLHSGPTGDLPNYADLVVELQRVMADDVGPFRTHAGLERGIASLGELDAAVGTLPPKPLGAYDARLVDWLDLRNMLLVARTVAETAIDRTESRGAHQREDFPGLDDAAWRLNHVTRLVGGKIVHERRPLAA